MKAGRAKTKVIKEEEPEANMIDSSSHIELSNLEKESAKANFQFYDKEKRGYVERFELPMLLSACGYNLPDDQILKLNLFLDSKKAPRIDLSSLVAALTYLKEI